MKNRRLKIFLEELKEDKLAILAVICLTIIILASLFAFLSPYDPNKTNPTLPYLTPSLAHPFGTDNIGRDYFTRALYGTRVSLQVGFFAVLISSVIGVAVGTVSGYSGGFVDFILMRITEIFLTIPFLVVVTVLSIFLGSSLFSLVLIIGLFSWMTMARLIRAETLSIKEREFVQYAKASGQTTFMIIIKHVIPGIYPVYILTATAGIAGAIMSESFLSFLGLGLKPPNSSLGNMIALGQGDIRFHPILSLAPGAIIFVIVLSLNKIGQVIRIAVEPSSNMDN